MFIDTWIVFTAPPVFGAIGFLVCAMFAAGKVDDLSFGDAGEPECLNCYDCGWVCESHRDQPWAGTSNVAHACDCGGAGSPCPVCEWDLATAGVADESVRAHTRANDALNAKTARIDRLKEIASSQQSVKSGRIIAVLEGEA